jgi:formylglycine-generating enzyme required for sulfatase activity
MLSLEQRTRTQSDLRDAAVQSRTERAVEALDQTLADARNAITRGEFDTADTALDKLAESQQQLPAMVAARDRARDLNQALNTPRCRMVMPTEFAEMASLDLKAATDADLGHIAAALDLWTQMFERLDGTLRPRCALEEAVEKGNLTRAAAEARALGDAYERAGQFLAAHEKLTACRNRLAQLTGRTDEYGGFLDAAKQRVARAESVLTQGRFEDAASALDAVVDFIGQAGDAVAARRTCADLLRQVEGRSVPDDLAGGLSAAKALAGQARQAAERAEAVQAAKSWTEASGLLESRVLPALRFEDALAASGGELEAAGLVEAARAVPDYARAQLYRQLVEQVQALRQKVTEVFQADPAPTIRDAVQRRFADAVAQAATGDLKGSREALTATADLLEGIDTMLAQRREIRQALDVLAKPPERDELTSDLQSLRTLDQSAQTACGENDLDRAAAQWQKARELLETPRVRFELALRNGRIDDALAIAAEGLADTYEPAGQALGLRDRLHECGEQVRELKKAARGKLAPAAAAVETEYTGVLAGMGTRGLPETADMLADIRNRLETLSKLNSLYNPFFGVMSGLDTSDLSDEGRRQIAAMQRMARRLDVLLDGQRFDGAYALLDGQRSEIAAFTASLDYWSRWHADSVDLVFVRVQKGRYYAAQGNEVVISAPTWMGQSEVTRSQFETVMGYLPSRASGTTADAPVDGIRFRDAADFCRTLTLKERDEGRLPLGMIYRLPSEAEWEYCSRAGNSQPLDIASVKYWFPEQSWYKENSGGALHAVGEREPNRWGLNDMFGNVWELCGDWSGNRLPAVRMVDPRGPQAGTEKVIRGGSCKSDMDVCLARADAPYERYYDLLGFRVVLARAPGTPEFRTVPAGVYQIGSIGGLFSGERGRKEDETRHSVRITKSYDIQTHEVTHREYEDVLGWIEGMAGRSAEDRQRPVSAVSWRDAVRYCETLTDLHRQAGLIDAQTRYRLPTEAEWEVACRAGSDLPFGFEGGDAKLGKHAWFAGSSGGDVKPVKALWPNEFGLYDMHGNVWEWCLDQCRREDPNARGPDVVVVTDTYRDGIVDPVGKEGPQRILRGGSYRSYSAQCRAAFRYALPPDTHLPDVGFRIVRDRVPPPGQDAPAPE